MWGDGLGWKALVGSWLASLLQSSVEGAWVLSIHDTWMGQGLRPGLPVAFGAENSSLKVGLLWGVLGLVVQAGSNWSQLILVHSSESSRL